MSNASDSNQVKSMTAFAKTQGTFSKGTFSWEVRSVNHRYLEIQPKLPDMARFLEMTVRDSLKQQLSRGKVDLFLAIKLSNQADSFHINQSVLHSLVGALNSIQTTVKEARQINPIDLLEWPGVLDSKDADSDELNDLDQSLLIGKLEEALSLLTEHRLREGQALAQLILKRCHTIEKEVKALQKLLPEVIERYINKLKERILSLSEQLDQDRLHQEIAIMSQKMDVDEELDRLLTHIKEVKHVLNSAEPIGRRLDFLMQELNREANTLGSKSIDPKVSKTSVELKVLIEQMREQVQNIE